MKVLHVIPGLSPAFGGPTNALLRLACLQAEAGIDAQIMTTDADISGRLSVPLDREVLRDGVRIRYFPVQGPLRYKYSYPLWRALKAGVRGFDAVHIHALFQFSTFAAGYWCRKYRVPYLVRPLGQLDPYSLAQHAFVKRCYLALTEKRCLERAWGVHFTTEEEQSLAGRLGLHIRGVVVGLGFDPRECARSPEPGLLCERFPQLRGKKVVLFLGRLHYKKGLEVLVRAFAGVCRRRADAVLLIAGPDNEGYSSRVKAWLKEEGAEDRAVFSGMLEGDLKRAAFCQSDVFALPSYSENFGVAVAEAMAYGLPVIVSDKVNLASRIAQRAAGVVVPAGDAPRLGEALERVLADPDYRRELSSRGKEMAWEEFDLRASVRALQEVYARMRASGASATSAASVASVVSEAENK